MARSCWTPSPGLRSAQTRARDGCNPVAHRASRSASKHGTGGWGVPRPRSPARRWLRHHRGTRPTAVVGRALLSLQFTSPLTSRRRIRYVKCPDASILELFEPLDPTLNSRVELACNWVGRLKPVALFEQRLKGSVVLPTFESVNILIQTDVALHHVSLSHLHDTKNEKPPTRVGGSLIGRVMRFGASRFIPPRPADAPGHNCPAPAWRSGACTPGSCSGSGGPAVPARSAGPPRCRAGASRRSDAGCGG